MARYGGLPGLRDEGLLESAVAQAVATFGGEYLHNDIFQMAAAYLFHIVQNHPFVDGNKRAGAAAAVVFLGSTTSRSMRTKRCSRISCELPLKAGSEKQQSPTSCARMRGRSSELQNLGRLTGPAK